MLMLMQQACDPACCSCVGQVLLNLDTEDWGEIFIGCAGGGDSTISVPISYEASPSSGVLHYDLKVSGVRGPLLPENKKRTRRTVKLACLLLFACRPPCWDHVHVDQRRHTAWFSMSGGHGQLFQRVNMQITTSQQPKCQTR